MVAFNELEVDVAYRFAPTNEELVLTIHVAVKKITDNDELGSLEKLQRGEQALQVFFINGLRKGNARFAEMARFAEVQVGAYQCALFFPEYCSARREEKSAVKYFVGQKTVHGGAKINGAR